MEATRALEAMKVVIRSNVHMNSKVFEVADYKYEVNFDLWNADGSSYKITMFLLYLQISSRPTSDDFTRVYFIESRRKSNSS